MKKIYSFIPARSGSKGVPGKNIKNLNGQPLIAYSIKASLKSENICRTIVSTDSEEIAHISRKYGAEVPFLRPTLIAGDNSTDIEFVLHALEWLKKNEGTIPDYIVHLRPTTPLRNPEFIDLAINSFIKNPEATSLRSVHEMPQSSYKNFEIEKIYLKCVGSGTFDLDEANKPRQSFRTTYDANGYVDILKSSFIIKNKLIHGNRVMAFITPKAFEIDSIEDFQFIEYISKINTTLTHNLFN